MTVKSAQVKFILRILYIVKHTEKKNGLNLLVNVTTNYEMAINGIN